MAASAQRPEGQHHAVREGDVVDLKAIWALRFAASDTPEAKRWALCTYVLLQKEARRMYPRWFPDTDAWLREQAWSSLWQAWCRRPPTRAADHFEEERQILAYVHVSLRHALLSLLRRRRRRAQLEDLHRLELTDVNVLTIVPGESIERVEESVALERALTFLDQALPLLLWNLRPVRGDEVRRILAERMGITRGQLTFAACVERIVVDEGISARRVANRLRQQYGRARREILQQLTEHSDLVGGAGHDIALLQRIVSRVFSDGA